MTLKKPRLWRGFLLPSGPRLDVTWGLLVVDKGEMFVVKVKPFGGDLRSFGTRKKLLVDGITGFVPIFQRTLKVSTCELSSPQSF